MTAIRSTASILSDDADIDPEWQARFLRNMREESRRLSASAQGLVDYLDAGADLEATPLVPHEEMAAFLGEHGFSFPELEPTPDPGNDDYGQRIATIVQGADQLQSDEARQITRAWLERYVEDARALPMAEFAARWSQVQGGQGQQGLLTGARSGAGIEKLAGHFATSIDRILRRAAALPEEDGTLPSTGLLICDGAGAITFRKPIKGFALPRFGAGCPLWPLYSALSRPGAPVSAVLDMGGRSSRRFHCLAISCSVGVPQFDRPLRSEVTMLILPEDEAVPFSEPAIQAGSSCRVCAHQECAARREPSILAG